MFRDSRIRWASQCGRVEHFAGRIIAAPIIFSLLINWAGGDMVNFGVSAAIFVCWLIYLVSHTLEKALYPATFRGG